MLRVQDLREERELYRTGGVYVVVGGAGALGKVWTGWMQKHYRARIVWVGRRSADLVEGDLRELTENGLGRAMSRRMLPSRKRCIARCVRSTARWAR